MSDSRFMSLGHYNKRMGLGGLEWSHVGGRGLGAQGRGRRCVGWGGGLEDHNSR